MKKSLAIILMLCLVMGAFALVGCDSSDKKATDIGLSVSTQ